MRVLALLLLLPLVLAITEDLYDLLGVAKTATDEEIKKAFKRQSLKLHPDRNRGNLAAVQKEYAKVSTAYDVLMDPDKRKAYNMGGEKGVSDWEQNASERKRQKEWRDTRRAKNLVYPSIYANTAVHEVDPNDYPEFYSRKVSWLANFYHPTCGHCVQYKPEYIEIAKRLAGVLKVVSINCSANFDFCEDHWIGEYPTIIFFPADTTAPWQRYTGDRSWGVLEEFVTNRVTSYVRPVTKNSIEEFLETSPKLAKVLYFNDKRFLSPVIKIVSQELREQVVFGEVSSSDTVLPARYQVYAYPRVVGVTAAGASLTYTGELLVKPLTEWILSFSGTSFGTSEIMELTEDLQSKVGSCSVTDTGVCVVIFADSEAALPVYRLKPIAAQFKKDPVKFYWVNRGVYKETFARFGDAIGVVWKPKKFKIMGFSAVESLKDTLPNVVTGGGTWEKLANPLMLAKGKSEL
jgi:thiol-disulfide isomerase/thioredoxin